MNDTSNITNQIKQPSAGNLFDAAKSGNDEQQVKGLGDFIALLMQNIKQTSQPQESGEVNLKEQVQELLQQSPEELTALLQQAQGQEGSENSNPLLSLLGAIGIKPEEIGLDTKQLPPSLIGQATALQAQLLSQETSGIIEQPIVPKQNIATIEQPNNNFQALQGAPATSTQTTPSFTPVAGAPTSPVLSNNTDTTQPPISTENALQSQNSKTTEISSGQTTGQTTGEAIALSFNAGDALKSFLPADEAGRKPRNMQNVTANLEQPSSEKSLPQQSVPPMTQQGQQQPTQISSTPIVVTTPNFADISIPASSTSPFMTSLISGEVNTATTQFLNTTSSPDIITDSQMQGRPTTAQSFASFITAKAGVFQSPSSQQIYMNMQKNAAAKIEQLTLQLEPQALGRIEINMKFSKNGSMKAHIIVEKQDTMGLLQRDANALENALKDAGIELGDSALSFDLASSGDHFDKTREQQESDNQFLLDMMMDNDTKTEITDASIIANQNGYIGQDSVNILI